MKKLPASSSTVKLGEAEMKAALQLIQLSGDSCSNGDDVESSVQGSMEEESTCLPANAKKKTKFRSISSLNYNLQDENNADSDSKLPLRDEKDQNYYRLKEGIPRSVKFRSVTDLYKCTNRLSPVEDEYNWSRPAGKNSNMNISTKEESSITTNKNNVGCKRKWRDNQKDKGKKDVATSSTSKVAKILNYSEVNADGEIVDKTGYVNKQKFRSMVDIYEATKPVMNMKKN